MPVPGKPRHRSGYSAEEFEQVKSACLTVALTLSAYLDDVCIVADSSPPCSSTPPAARTLRAILIPAHNIDALLPGLSIVVRAYPSPV